MKTMMKVLVGSQAHGLATSTSDFDYRGVFILPTTEILKLGGHKQQTSWIEGKDDDTSWELGHFLFLATKCNPTILEAFLAPRVDHPTREVDDGDQLRSLFPYIWNSRDVMNAFIGYGLNQRKKFLDEKDGRPHKFAAAYLRSLYNAWELLSRGTFTIKIADTPIGDTVRRFKEGQYEIGEVIDRCVKAEKEVRRAYEDNPDKVADLDKINEFLIAMRQKHWN
jgi:uncharacterized protein